MSCCCENPLIVGCFCVGRGFVLSFDAPADGLIYTLSLEYNGAYIELYSEPTNIGQPVYFDTAMVINPFYDYTGTLVDENGDEVLLYGADGDIFDCVQISPRTGGKKGVSDLVFLTPQAI